MLTDLLILRGVTAFIRSDNGPEFVAQSVRDWINAVGAKTAYIEPGSPWANGYCESFNAHFRDKLLNGEIFYTLKEAEIIIEIWRKHYNTNSTAQCFGLPPTRPGNYSAGGNQAGHALAFKLDHSIGPDQCRQDYRTIAQNDRAGMSWS